MDSMTLRELCCALGVTRRAVQGYEKAGLISATDKNKYGHLLYDTNIQERVRNIKLYQRFGFTLKEIQGLIDAPGPIIKAALEKQVWKLKGDREEIEFLIEKAYEIINSL